MGCGPAYMNSRTVGAGSKLSPYYFGQRPSPVRPIALFGDWREELHAWRYPNHRRVLRTHRVAASNGYINTTQRVAAQFEDWRVAQGNDCCAQGWREGNLLAAQTYPLPVRATECGCASLNNNF